LNVGKVILLARQTQLHAEKTKTKVEFTKVELSLIALNVSCQL